VYRNPSRIFQFKTREGDHLGIAIDSHECLS
jgi:hypothetical protein